MATIVTRSGKGSALTHTEMDANFGNLNTDKAELAGAAFTGAVSMAAALTIDSGAGADLALDEAGLYYDSTAVELLGIENDGTGDVTLQVDGITSLPPTTAGTQPAYTATYGITSLVTDRIYEVQIHSTNTATATLNLDSIGAKPIVDREGVAFANAQLVADTTARLLYDGTSFRLQNVYVPTSDNTPGFLYLGSGADGAKTVSTSEDLPSGEYHYTSLTINSGQTLGVSESSGGWLLIRCTGTVSLTSTSTIDLDGKGEAGGASQSTAGTDGNTGSVGNGGGTGGGGGSSDSTDKGGAGGISAIRGISIAGGAQSADGPNQDGGAGVAVSTMLQNIIQSQAGLELYSINGSGGGSGGYRTGAASGAGGNGGGGVIIIADIIDFPSGAIITSDGANGGAATSGTQGSGGGGGGGVIILASNTYTSSAGTVTVTGGTGGADAGNGGIGGTGGNGAWDVITL